jgi:hypothetical protein
MSTVEAAVNKVIQDSLAQQTLAETNKVLLENLQTVSEQVAVSLKTQAKLECQVAKLMVLTSPASAKKHIVSMSMCLRQGLVVPNKLLMLMTVMLK